MGLHNLTEALTTCLKAQVLHMGCLHFTVDSFLYFISSSIYYIKKKTLKYNLTRWIFHEAPLRLSSSILRQKARETGKVGFFTHRVFTQVVVRLFCQTLYVNLLPHLFSYLPFQPTPCVPAWSRVPTHHSVSLWQWSKQQSRLLCWKSQTKGSLYVAPAQGKTSYICHVFVF